jgi:hypothetical protein
VIDERAAIEQFMRNYENAYNSKSLDAIRGVQILSEAEAKRLQNTFQEAREYKMTVQVQTITIAPTGGQATVTGLRRILFRSRFDTQDKPVQVLFTLQKRGAVWMVVSVAVP